MSEKKISEKRLERKLVNEVEALGGVCLKYHNSFDTSYPDRIVILPGGKCGWVEVKTTGEKPDMLQRHKINKLKRLGQKVYVADSYESLNICLKMIMR